MILRNRPKVTQESPSKRSIQSDQMELEEEKQYEIDEDQLEFNEENKASTVSPAKSVTRDSELMGPEVFESLLKLRDSLEPVASKYIPDYIKAQKRFVSNPVDSLSNVLDPAMNNDRFEGLVNDNEPLLYKYREAFNKWGILIDCGFNILFYNIGSKMRILNEFCEYLSSRGGVRILAHGFHTAFNIRRLLTDIMRAVNIYPARTKTLQEIIFRLQIELKENVYILLHNLDGVNIRDAESQELLSLLASHPYVRFITDLSHSHS